MGAMIGGWLVRYWAGLALVLVGAAVAIGATWLGRQAPPPVTVQSAPTRPPNTPTTSPRLTVYVSGEVARPGVYTVPGGSRVRDAIAAAGGLTARADADRLNPVARLSDGQRVAVTARPTPRPSPSAAASPSPGPPGQRVNINTATVAELDRLPGFGPVTAQRVVARREQRGPFSRIQQLVEERILTPAAFERVKDLIVV
ncbi:MAG: ComEA family DNA-binding protein [Chloroflexota bacterium]